jgi:putative ABC transport system permease protein
MRTFDKLRLRLRSLFLRSRAERELEDEIRFHLESQIAENTGLGMSPCQARAAALRAMGGVPQIEEACRDTRATAAWEGFLRDLRHGARLLRKNPAYAASSIAVLALGIAATTAIFSAAYGVLLRPLPFPESDRLVRLWDTFGNPGNLAPVSYPNFRDWRAWNQSFSAMAAFQEGNTVLTGSGEPTPLQSIAASASFLDLLGVRPALGRTFRVEEEHPGANNGAGSVILSDRLWRARFGADPSMVGVRITLGGQPFVVIGVMPPGFNTFTGSGDIDVWTTLAGLERVRPGMTRPFSEERGISNLNTIGRLKRGVSLEQARADMARVASLLMRNYPADDSSEGVALEGLQQSASAHVRPMLLVLLWAAAAVLLIACADASGLALARVTGRQREISVRAAIGAGKWRIIRQLLAESLVLAFCGAAAGVMLAILLARCLTVFLQLAPGDVSISWPALAFASLAAALSAIVFSLAPAIHALRFDLLHGLKEASASVTASSGQKRLQNALAAGQIALAMVLLTACGLLSLNMIHLRSAGLGFDPQRAFTFQIGLPTARYPQSDRFRFADELTAKLRAVPGVLSVSASTQMPFRGFVPRTVLSNVAGKPVDRRNRIGIVYSSITPDYFRALGIPLKRGRAFTANDDATAPPVVVLNEAAVRHYFGNVDPIGLQVTPEMWNGSGSATLPRTVVGVVGDIALRRAGEKPLEVIYWPMPQIASETVYWISMRTAGDPLTVAGAAREQLRHMDRNMPFFQASPLSAAVESSFLQPRYNTALVAFFAVLALVLTAVGLYGNIAHSVSQRKHEIGIRIALGAGKDRVQRQFLRGGLAMGVAGVGIGLVFAKVASRIMRSLVFGASVDEPLAFAFSAAVAIAVAVLASYLPARRAARIDPMNALRND